MFDPLPEHLRTPLEAARYLGTSVNTVYRLIRSGKLRASKVGGQWRIADTALREFLEDGINV
jgi:excisionase family DNA binding protein